ncbi:MAG: stage II sporulation protein M [Candidatus Paceibacterota bacterium]
MKGLLVQLPYYFAWSVGIFALGVLLGVLVFLFAPGTAEFFLADLAAFAKSALDGSAWEVLVFIFINNTVKGLGAVLFGVLFALIPVAFLLINGFMLGIVVAYAINAAGVLWTAASILPHGVIELPAVFIATSLGLLLGVHLVKRIRRETSMPITHVLLDACRLFVVALVPLFFLASVIEVFITPAVVEMLFR